MTGPGRGWKRTKINWRFVLDMLRSGHRVKDIAAAEGCSPRTLRDRAKADLSPADLATYSRLAAYNRNNSPWRAKQAKCGTDSGYHAHKRRGERACPECCVAHAEAMRKYRPPKGERAPSNTKCGTPGGYYKHYRSKSVPCRPCMDAHTADQARMTLRRRERNGTERA